MTRSISSVLDVDDLCVYSSLLIASTVLALGIAVGAAVLTRALIHREARTDC